MSLLAPFILQNQKNKIWSRIDVPFSGPKWSISLEYFFFLVQTIIITFIYLLPLFIMQNLKKFLQWIQSYEDAPFLAPKWSICPNQFFFWKIIYVILIYLLAPFHCAKFLKTLPADPELWGCATLGTKMTHLPKWEFFHKPINEPCFFHSCLSTCQKSKSDINLLVKYWS